MARVEKKTRIKGLPPRVQLTNKDATTGSYPMVSAGPVSGSRGISWNDNNTIRFGSGSSVSGSSISDSLIAYWIPTFDENSFAVRSLVNGGADTTLRENVSPNPMSPTGSMPFVGRYYGNLSETVDQYEYLNKPSFTKPLGSALEVIKLAAGEQDSPLAIFDTSRFRFATPGASWEDRPFSLSFWFKSEEFSGGGASPVLGVFQTLASTSDTTEVKIEITSVNDGAVKVWLYQNGTNYIWKEYGHNIAGGGWIHLGVSYDGSKTIDGIQIYQNGQTNLADTGSLGTYGGMPASSSQVHVGSSSNSEDMPYFISELAVFDKALSHDEFKVIFEADVPLDRLGKFNIGAGLTVDNSWVQTNENATSLFMNAGNVVQGIVDGLAVVELSSGHDLYPSRPFVDSAQDAAEGKSNNDPFYATGSNIEGFKDPLWSKNRIEIDFTPRVESVMSGSRGQWLSYYNWDARKWDARLSEPGANVGIGGRKYDPVGIGFSPSLHPLFGANGVPKQNGAKGKPFSNFGFPFDATFHATSSQLLNVSNYIDRPFVVEKIVVMMSASYTKAVGSDIWDDAIDWNSDPLYEPGAAYQMCSSSYLVNNFFILNQRKGTAKNESISILDRYGETSLYLSQSQNPYGTIRDLVTWFEIASFNNDHGNVYTASLNPNLFYRDYTIVNSGSTDAMFSSWTQNLVMSSSVRSPNFLPKIGESYIGAFADIDIGIDYYPIAWLGSRSGLGGVKSSGRDMRNPLGSFTGEILSDMMIGGNPDSWHRDNPYILMPGDQLVFGWQVPTIDYEVPWNPNLTVVSASIAHFPVSPAKVVLYGSYVSEGEGVNDTLEQILTSNSIHEAIK